MSLRFISTIIANSLVQIGLAHFLGVLTIWICLPLGFQNLILTVIFGLANRGFKQKQNHKVILQRTKLFLKKRGIFYFLLIAFSSLSYLYKETPQSLFSLTSITIWFHSIYYLILISDCRLTWENNSE